MHACIRVSRVVGGSGLTCRVRMAKKGRKKKERRLGKVGRHLGGGQSERYAARKAARGSGKVRASEWGWVPAAAAHAALGVLLAGQPGVPQCDMIMRVLTVPSDASAMMKALVAAGSARIAARAKVVLDYHSARARAAGLKAGTAKARPMALAVLRRIFDESRGVRSVGVLNVPFEPQGPSTYHDWLAKDVATETVRDIKENARILDGLSTWELEAEDRPAVVVYERAARRIRDERPQCRGWVPGSFVRGLLHRKGLPTAVASSGDHYVLVEWDAAGRAHFRFLSVEEVGRAFGLRGDSPVWAALTGGPLNALQAVRALGNGVLQPVMRGIVRELVAAGLIVPGGSYGGAFVGIDTVAASVLAEVGALSYIFGSQSNVHNGSVRAGLLKAWGPYGLTEEMCFFDALSEEAVNAPYVSTFVLTGECCEHSDANSGKEDNGELVSLEDIDRALDYVRNRKPRVVLMENVSTPWVVLGVNALIGGIDDYVWEAARIDPTKALDWAMGRVRHYWVGKRK